MFVNQLITKDIIAFLTRGVFKIICFFGYKFCSLDLLESVILEISDEKSEILDAILSPLSDKERIYVKTYCYCLNKTEAAKAAGCPQNALNQRGYEIYNRKHINEAIQAYLKAIAITPEDNIRLIENAAKSNLSDYMSPVQYIKSDWIEKPLKDIIRDLKDEQDIEDEYMMSCELSEHEQETLLASAKSRSRRIIKFEIELRRDPLAVRIVKGPEYLYTEMVLDINKVVADKAQGRIKKLKHTKEGVQIELCDADAAQDRLAKIHGSYRLDNEQQNPTVKLLSFDPLAPVPDAANDSTP